LKAFSKYKNTPEYITRLSRRNRDDPTPQEEKLWKVLSSRKIGNTKFRRQFPIGRYIVDFYNHSNKLVIEVDGKIHNSTVEYDKNRDDYLGACGCNVLHFTNDQIDNAIETVITTIVRNISVKTD